jgi:cyclin-dependent kinase 7
MANKYFRLGILGEGAHGIVYKAVRNKVNHNNDNNKDNNLTPNNKRKVMESGTPMSLATEPAASDSAAMIPLQSSENVVAIKKIRLRSLSEGLSMEAIREIKLLQEFSHPNVLSILDIFNLNSNLNVVLQYMCYDLENIIKSPEIILCASDIKQFVHQILSGLAYCHENFMMHRDLKPSNCLIGTENVLKLADFGTDISSLSAQMMHIDRTFNLTARFVVLNESLGLARLYGSPDRRFSPQACTIWYRAPELLYGATDYSNSMDIWSATNQHQHHTH